MNDDLLTALAVVVLAVVCAAIGYVCGKQDSRDEAGI